MYTFVISERSYEQSKHSPYKYLLNNIGFENCCKKTFSKVSQMEQFSKKDYEDIVKVRRREFVHKYFETPIVKAFNTLREEANRMRNCHTEVTLEIPDHFDLHKTTEMIRQYFLDLGYEPIHEPSKIDSGTIRFTLT